MSIESFRRMPPSAAATSGMLHALIVLAIVAQMSPAKPRYDPPLLEISIQPSEPTPPDPASLTVPSQAPRLAAPDPPPPPPPGPDLADLLPPPDEVPPITMRDLPRPLPAPPPVHHAVQAVAPARPAQPPSARLRQVREDYLLQVIQKLSRTRYVPQSRLAVDHGVVVTRLTVARDGRLLGAELTRSSGDSDLDSGMMQAIRGVAPFAPLPADFEDDALTLTVPISFAPSRP